MVPVNKENFKKRLKYEVDEYNTYQNFLYRRLMFGIKAYKEEDIQKMSENKKNSVNALYKKAQLELNLWKQSITNELCNNLLKTLFHKSILATMLVETYGTYTNPNYFNTINFKDLGISKKDIINKLIFLKLLPENYFNLKTKV